jgi:hypothetical protein
MCFPHGLAEFIGAILHNHQKRNSHFPFHFVTHDTAL